MPELPEVETVRRSLEPHLVGLEISGVRVLLPKIVRHLPPERFQQILTGRRFREVKRRGKYLLAHLDGGWTLVVHLGMSGRLIYAPAGENCFGGQPAEQKNERAAELTAEQFTELTPGLTVGQISEQISEQLIERIAEQPAQQIIKQNAGPPNPQIAEWFTEQNTKQIAGQITEQITGQVPRHVHAMINLDDGGLLYYHDLRQFGYLTVCRTGEYAAIKGLQNLGPEPLSGEFKRETLQAALCRRKVRVKQLLLDQGLVAGIGNIYADESLFAAGIHPERTGDSLTLEEFEKLYQSIRQVLQQGIEHRGTSIVDYVDGEGQPGDFQNCLQVYRRTGQECPQCAGVIQRIKVGGRSSHFCPHCQPKPEML